MLCVLCAHPTVTSNILLPTELETAMSPNPLRATITDVIRSGIEVPAARNVKPMTWIAAQPATAVNGGGGGKIEIARYVWSTIVERGARARIFCTLLHNLRDARRVHWSVPQWVSE